MLNYMKEFGSQVHPSLHALKYYGRKKHMRQTTPRLDVTYDVTERLLSEPCQNVRRCSHDSHNISP